MNHPNFDHEVYLATLAKWADLVKQLEELKKRELTLRWNIFDYSFPNPREGVNTAALPGGFILKGNHKLSRSLDETMIAAVKEELRGRNVNADLMFRSSTSLDLAFYKEQPSEIREVVDAALTTKDAAPSLEICEATQQTDPPQQPDDATIAAHAGYAPSATFGDVVSAGGTPVTSTGITATKKKPGRKATTKKK